MSLYSPSSLKTSNSPQALRCQDYRHIPSHPAFICYNSKLKEENLISITVLSTRILACESFNAH